ncbi:hypothetical protein JOC34_000522 [Virgibacillus halotolerans]|uniref:hypothetical protein n=1 Tax=Virgibacillus halotolerans TaxID=1071053 RepID=UPI00195F8473|nr:hypothetical protein [Virgibacillus halotolerans]MBM7598165.1 hypothetical protein [Virgibacillus halotolerans]
MKNRLLFTTILILIFLIGCGQIGSTKVSAGLPSGFELVSEDEINQGDVYKARETATGCYYIFGTSGSDYRTTVSIEQMTIEKDGARIPYCE